MIVPDGIEPIEEWRTWRFDGATLRSHSGQEWQPGEAMKAECEGGNAVDFEWQIVRHGRTLEAARTEASAHNGHQLEMQQVSFSPFSGPRYDPHFVSTPFVEPPPGYGYTLVRLEHAAPHEGCTCGIYAGRTLDRCPPGDIGGKVKLWGKIVPGTQGSRAEFAYPSELHVPEKLVDDNAILAYGVPVVASEHPVISSSLQMAVAVKSNARARNAMLGALALNIGCATFNILHGTLT